MPRIFTTNSQLTEVETTSFPDGATRRVVWCAGVPYPSLDMVKVFWGKSFEGLKLRVRDLARGAMVAAKPANSEHASAVVPEQVTGCTTNLAYWVEDCSNRAGTASGGPPGWTAPSCR